MFCKKTILAIMCIVALPGAQGRVNDFEDRVLSAHNRERAAMGVEKLSWDDELARGAQRWADYLSRTGKFHHSTQSRGRQALGENLWGGTAGHFTAEHMIGRWIDEKEHFRRGKFPFNSETGDVADVGHYTQVIWRDTRRVGCALSDVGAREIVVCRYAKPGNIAGSYPLGR